MEHECAQFRQFETRDTSPNWWLKAMTRPTVRISCIETRTCLCCPQLCPNYSRSVHTHRQMALNIFKLTANTTRVDRHFDFTYTTIKHGLLYASSDVSNEILTLPTSWTRWVTISELNMVAAIKPDWNHPRHKHHRFQCSTYYTCWLHAMFL